MRSRGGKTSVQEIRGWGSVVPGERTWRLRQSVDGRRKWRLTCENSPPGRPAPTSKFGRIRTSCGLFADRTASRPAHGGAASPKRPCHPTTQASPPLEPAERPHLRTCFKGRHTSRLPPVTNRPGLRVSSGWVFRVCVVGRSVGFACPGCGRSEVSMSGADRPRWILQTPPVHSRTRTNVVAHRSEIDGSATAAEAVVADRSLVAGVLSRPRARYCTKSITQITPGC